MSSIKPIGRNQAIMELDGLFGKGERFACTGDDFAEGTIAQVQQVLSQRSGSTRIHVLFETGGVSENAKGRAKPLDRRAARSSGGFQEREIPTFAQSRRRARAKEEKLIRLNERERIAENPQSQHIIHDGLGPMNVSPETPGASVVSTVSARGIPQASAGGFSTIVSESIRCLPGSTVGGGPKATADRPFNPNARGGYMTVEEHAEAINNQIDPGSLMGMVQVDKRVGQVGGWRRSELLEQRTVDMPIHELRTTQEAIAEAVAAMEEDGVNPRSPVRGLQKRY